MLEVSKVTTFFLLYLYIGLRTDEFIGRIRSLQEIGAAYIVRLEMTGVEIDATYATTAVVLNACSQTDMADLYALKGAKGTVTVK